MKMTVTIPVRRCLPTGQCAPVLQSSSKEELDRAMYLHPSQARLRSTFGDGWPVNHSGRALAARPAARPDARRWLYLLDDKPHSCPEIEVSSLLVTILFPRPLEERQSCAGPGPGSPAYPHVF